MNQGEVLLVILFFFVTSLFGSGNLISHAIKGNVKKTNKRLIYFGQGVIAAGVILTVYFFSLEIPYINNALKMVVVVYGIVHISGLIVSIIGGLLHRIYRGNWQVLQNAGKIFLGNFYLDENRSFFGGVWQGISRHTWEFIQTALGHTWAQLRNTYGAVNRVDYLGGVTFATTISQKRSNGISLGSFIHISIWDKMKGDFDSRVISDPLFMHEYGHIFDSQIFGISYLFIIGLPSLISAVTAIQLKEEPIGVTTHDFKLHEMRANRHGARYFSKYYRVNWTTFECLYPRKKTRK